VTVALYDAFIYCRDGGYPKGGEAGGFPKWVLDGLQQVLSDRLQDGFDRGVGGRRRNEKSGYRDDMMHYFRHLAFEQAKASEPSLTQARAKASELLKSTIGQGEPRQIGRSHAIVEKALQTDEGRTRFYLASFAARKLIEI
tara:strand:- start:395 stop:817 length:423 start_codon:yes stop_codon:yes gene_type:complete